MATLEEVNGMIEHDIQQLINGIQEHNVFLIQRALPNVQHHINWLDSLLPFYHSVNEAPHLVQVKNFMQQLFVLGSNTLIDHESANTEDHGAIALTSQLDVELVLYLRNSGLPWSKIGEIFSLSRQSMYNFRKSNGIEEPNMNLDDASLEAVLPSIMNSFPAAGAVMVRGILLANGFKININRIKTAMKRIDPFAVHLRKRQKITRKVYNVRGPNFLWHIDGTHKLVMFRMVVHGCIDGYSRFLIFSECSTTNTAETVVQKFLTGVEEFGVPRRVRGDHGGENALVRQFMLAVMGEGRGSFIMGQSVHNQRIERFWRDLNEQVINHYKEIFLFLESQNILNERSILDLICLHYIYLPRISNSLMVLRHGYNKHSVRTEGSRTPEQLWLAGMIREGFHIKLNNINLDISYDQEYWLRGHVETFSLDLDQNVLSQLLNRSMHIVPNPLEDDSNSGVTFYANLRSSLLSEFIQNHN